MQLLLMLLKYSSTCHKWTPLGQSKNIHSWQVPIHGRDRKWHKNFMYMYSIHMRCIELTHNSTFTRIKSCTVHTHTKTKLKYKICALFVYKYGGAKVIVDQTHGQHPRFLLYKPSTDTDLLWPNGTKPFPYLYKTIQLIVNSLSSFNFCSTSHLHVCFVYTNSSNLRLAAT